MSVVHHIFVFDTVNKTPQLKSKCGLYAGEMGEFKRKYVTCKRCLKARRLR